MNEKEHIEDLNKWLSYSIEPSKIRNYYTWLSEGVSPQPAMWGNGRIELLAELHHPSVCEAVCFGFGVDGLEYREEEHLIPAVYDASSGRKYLTILKGKRIFSGMISSRIEERVLT